MEIPEVLASGHHAEISCWRKAQAEMLTKLKRPDLWALYEKRGRSAKTPAFQDKQPEGKKQGKKQ
jgi:tRNA (guanine37-N1)-methyltransferase